jgi:hypothetical protein
MRNVRIDPMEGEHQARPYAWPHGHQRRNASGRPWWPPAAQGLDPMVGEHQARPYAAHQCINA